MRKLFQIAIFLLLSFSAVQGSHIIGGQFEVTQISSNDFDIELVIYRDCRTTGSPPPIQLQPTIDVWIIRKSDGQLYQTIQLNRTGPIDVELGTKCYQPSLCIEDYTMAGNSVTLPDSPLGYYLASAAFARNQTIINLNNPGGTGITFTAEIPDPALAGGNSTPRFGDYPSDGYFCLNQLRLIDLAAIDPDGDSLVYELTTPLDCTLSPSPPPYDQANWRNGYSLSNVLGSSIPLSMEPATGILSAHCDKIGVFVFSYKVSEYRNGVKIGEVRRDLQYSSLNCFIDHPPIITSPTDSVFSLTALGNLCLNVRTRDSNSLDSLVVRISSSPLGPNAGNSPLYSNVQGIGTANGLICWTPDCADAFVGSAYELTIEVESKGCESIQTATKVIRVEVEDITGSLHDLFPNVITPNNDGINDFFRLTDQESLPCMFQFELEVYNRWGMRVYSNPEPDFAWDGTFEGNDLPQGVYYYLVKGSYGDQVFQLRDFLTLLR